MSGQATLEFHTRTINDVNAQGTICVFVFIRKETAAECTPLPAPCDTQLIDLDEPAERLLRLLEESMAGRRLDAAALPDELLVDHGG